MVVLYGLFKIAESSVISLAKIAIRTSFSCLVSHVFSNAKMLLVVFNDLFKIALFLIRIAKIIISTSLSCCVTRQFFIIAEMFFLVIDGLSYSCPSGGSRGGARGAGPPLFWEKREEMPEGRRAGWTSKIEPGPLLSSKSVSATGALLLIFLKML